jgi:hypothetical protein
MAVTLAERLRTQSGECARLGSPLYAELLARAAEDVEAGGVVAETFAGREQLPGRLVPGLRLMGALHRLVLQGRAAELAAFYPSAGGGGRPADAWPAMRRVLARRREEVGALLDRPVQTNEVGRAAALFGGLLVAAAWFSRGPVAVRLLEVGTSGGLNLRADRFAYLVGGAGGSSLAPRSTVLGEAASPVRLLEPWVGTPVPDPGSVRVRVVERAGCDPHPVDPTTEEGRLTLASYVWADQVERMARLRAALQVAARVPARIERAGAAAWLERVLVEPAPGTQLTVVWHSVVWQYLGQQERERVEAALAAAAERARRGRGTPLACLALESRRVTDRYLFELRLQGSFLPEGLPVLALADGHGPPVRWWPEGPAALSPPPR